MSFLNDQSCYLRVAHAVLAAALHFVLVSGEPCGASQATVAGAKAEEALDIWLSAPGFRKAECDMLDSYIMAEQTQHHSSCSDSDCAADSRNSSELKDSDGAFVRASSPC